MTVGLDYHPPVSATEARIVELRRVVDDLRTEVDGERTRNVAAWESERRAFDALAERVSSLDDHVDARLSAIERGLAELSAAVRSEMTRNTAGAAAGGIGGGVVAALAAALVRYLGG